MWTVGIWTLTPYILKTSFMSPALMVSFCSLSLSCKHPVTSREVLMGVGDRVASVIMLTFTKRPGPHADFYKEARPPC